MFINFAGVVGSLSIPPCLGLKLALEYSWSILPTKHLLRAFEVPGNPVPAAWSHGQQAVFLPFQRKRAPWRPSPHVPRDIRSFFWAALILSLMSAQNGRWFIKLPPPRNAVWEDKRKIINRAWAPETLTIFLEMQHHQERKKSTYVSKSLCTETWSIYI